MALSKATATTHNLNRAEVFKAHGVSDWDVKYAHPQFLGKDSTPEGGTCTLCGQQHLLWLFAIRFDAPDLTVAIAAITKGITRTKEVAFNPVGSVCINDWMDALPESVEKLALLKRWKIEMEKEKHAKAEQAIGNALAKTGLETTEKAIERFKAAQTKLGSLGAMSYSAFKNGLTPLDWYERGALGKIGYRAAQTHRHTLKRKWGSVKTVNLFANILKKVEAWTGPTPAPKKIEEKVIDEILDTLGVDGNYQTTEAQAAAESATEESAAIGDGESLNAEVEPTTGGVQQPLQHMPEATEKTEVQQLLDRGTAVLASKEKLDRLNSFEQGAVKDICQKVKSHGDTFASDNQRDFLLKLITKAEATKEAIAATKAKLAEVGAPLLARGAAVLADPSKFGALNAWEQGTLKDIHAKVTGKHEGVFASGSQRGLFEKLVAKGEKGSAAIKPSAKGADSAEEDAAADKGPGPGAKGFVSASGVVGARY